MISILKQYWGYDHFRGIQQDIIESISAGRDTLGLMPTGGGKSITFQVPALAMEGVCIVITPLIALMKDQVQRLRRLGIRATAIYSGMSRQETLVALDNCVLGGIKLLYVSPERLASEQFQVKLRHMHVSFITVDEAHCISQWGYDFRPSYLEIANIRKLLPGVPILALTATATPRVIDDIQEQLQFQQKNVFKMSFERKNLAYIVRHTSDKQGQLLHILNAVPGSAIVYVRSRRRSKEIADFLNSQLYDASAKQKPATYYHAGLDHSVRDDRQTDWQQDKVRVMVATNAFGMGIDKPDVRLVIHMDCPSSIEAYFQEAGRAGRDGKKAYAVMLYRPDDHRKLEQRIASTFPDKEYILKVYEHLAYYYQMAVGDGYGVTREFDIERFCRTFRHFPVLADAALKILARAGYLDYETDPDNATRIRFLLSREQLYMLSEATPREELVITTLLRNYGGLFTDYAYISLEQIARNCNLTKDEVYLQLKALDHRGIVHFIPQRSTPTITWTQRRVETERVVLPRAIYEDRRELFVKRIRSMWLYCENNETCRSRQLLSYFGEERSTDCGQCDVCLHATSVEEGEEASFVREDWDEAKKKILDQLSDHQPHPVEILDKIGIPSYQLHAALRELLNDEVVAISESMVMLLLEDESLLTGERL